MPKIDATLGPVGLVNIVIDQKNGLFQDTGPLPVSLAFTFFPEGLIVIAVDRPEEEVSFRIPVYDLSQEVILPKIATDQGSQTPTFKIQADEVLAFPIVGAGLLGFPAPGDPPVMACQATLLVQDQVGGVEAAGLIFLTAEGDSNLVVTGPKAEEGDIGTADEKGLVDILPVAEGEGFKAL